MAVIINLFILEVFVISGNSMERTVQDGDFVLSEKISYLFSEPKIGDVIIVNVDIAKEKKIIKRVVGVEGDTIEIKNGILYRNNEEVLEEYIAEKMVGNFKKITIAPNHVYVLGDNRNYSKDSRILGTFTYERIEGKVIFEIYNDFLKIH